MTLAEELEKSFGDRAIDGLWCNVPAKTMLTIIAALRAPAQPVAVEEPVNDPDYYDSVIAKMDAASPTPPEGEGK